MLTSVIAVPKSIDNDILLIDKTFGFDTVVEEARKALLAAKVCCAAHAAHAVSRALRCTCCSCTALAPVHCFSCAAGHHQPPPPLSPSTSFLLPSEQVEASSTFRGIGLVKLMGRTSGFIAVKVRTHAKAMQPRGF